MKRGQIYFIHKRGCLGRQDTKNARPAIIVSADDMIPVRCTVQVVYLTTSPRGSLPTHVDIGATGTPSVALCEMIAVVDKTDIGNLCAECSAAEMDAVDNALRAALGLAGNTKKKRPDDLMRITYDIGHIYGERDAYRDTLRKVLERDGRV